MPLKNRSETLNSIRFKLIYLIGVAVSCFLIREPLVLGGLLAFHLVLWIWLGLPFQSLIRILRKLSFFVLMIIVTFSLVSSQSMQADEWILFSIFGFEIPINQTGLSFGLLMSMRLLTIVIVSMTVQLSGRPGEFVEGLRAIKIPTVAALTIDSTLALLGPGGSRKPGQGTGMGGGKGRGQSGKSGSTDAGQEITWKRFLRGDFGILIDLIESSLLKAKSHLMKTYPAMNPKMIHDVSVISGLCFLMLTAKLLKLLPGIPFAPGHKLLILIPLYILAAELTHSRFGSTITGTTVGIISFMFGDGRFGVFEILKHIAPGLVVDGILPSLKRWNPKPSRLTLVIVGTFCAAARIASIVAVTLLIEAPPLFYVLIVPMFISQTLFGGVSGFVTFYLLKSLNRFKQTMQFDESLQTLPADGPHSRAEKAGENGRG